jgi:hypothetical protein
MTEPNKNSNFDLPRGRWNFTNEPLWFKLVVYLITALFFFGVFMILKEWALPVLAASGFTAKFGSWFNKGRPP